MKSLVRKRHVLILAAVFCISGLGLSAAAVAADTAGHAATHKAWVRHHPRRHQVNKRLKKQNRRIHHEVKEGDLTKRQASALHKNDRAIRQEESDMAKQNNGHISKNEQHVLNQQENATSRQIGK